MPNASALYAPRKTGGLTRTALLFFIFSFYGWLLETAHFVLRWGKLTDRGFLLLPLCPVYGFAVCAAGLLLGAPRKGLFAPLFERADKLRPAARLFARGGLCVLYCFAAAVLPAGTELLTGALCDKALGIRLWNYAYKTNSLFGYIALDRALLWGALLAAVLAFVWEPLSESLAPRKPALARRGGTAAAVLTAAALADFAFNLLWLASAGTRFLLFPTVRF